MRASAPPAVGAIITTAAAAAAGRAVRPKQGPHGRACRLPPPELQFLGRTAVTYNMPACAQASGTRGDPCGGVVFCGGGVFGFFAPLSVVHTDSSSWVFTHAFAHRRWRRRVATPPHDGCNCRVLIAPAVPPWFGADWTPPDWSRDMYSQELPLARYVTKGLPPDLRAASVGDADLVFLSANCALCVHELTRTHCPS